MINVFIGYDPNEVVAFHVLAHSIYTRASQPVAVHPLMLSQLDGVMTRERDARQSTDFAFSRFLTPYLSNYEGWSLFLDCDELMLTDIAELWELRDDRFALQVVKHDHKPKEESKFLGQVQTQYPKKNWSSVMLFNNSKCKALTVDYVNRSTGLELHQFKWLESDDLIGELPPKWNHLVDYDPPQPASELGILHYTEGGPYFSDYENCGYAEEWRAERDAMLFAASSK